MNADCTVPVPDTIFENGWEEEVSCWKGKESVPALASNSESLCPSTLPLFFHEEDPLSQPEDNIAASSLELKAGECPAH